MKKTGPPGPRPKPRARRVKKKEEPELYTLHHENVKLGDTTYRVFLRVPRDELTMISSAAVAAHLRGKKPPIIGVVTEVRELLDEKEEYVVKKVLNPVKKNRTRTKS